MGNWACLALQLTFAYREVDENGVPLRRGFREVALHLGMNEDRCAPRPLRPRDRCMYPRNHEGFRKVTRQHRGWGHKALKPDGPPEPPQSLDMKYSSLQSSWRPSTLLRNVIG